MCVVVVLRRRWSCWGNRGEGVLFGVFVGVYSSNVAATELAGRFTATIETKTHNIRTCR